MFEFEAFEVLKIKEFAFVNDCFQNKNNEEIGHYGQTLIKTLGKKSEPSKKSSNFIQNKNNEYAHCNCRKYRIGKNNPYTFIIKAFQMGTTL